MTTFYTYGTLIVGVVLAFVSLRSCLVPEAENWGYKPGQSFKDPSQWRDLPGSRSCAGKRQSPIDISSSIIEYWSSLRTIKITEEPRPSRQVKMRKESHSIKIDFSDKWKITFGGQGCLKPLQMHWHWGSDNSKGSEHIKNGKAYPAEAHVVSYNCELYNSTAAAVVGASGLYVIGFFYQVGADNPVLSQLQKPLEELKTAASVSVDEIRLVDILPADLSRFYRYEGSLTTPPCTENVMWTMMEEELTIGKSQLEMFRSFTFSAPETGPMVDNFRPVIPINDSPDHVRRVIYSSFSASSVVLKNTISLSVSMVLCYFLMVSSV